MVSCEPRLRETTDPMEIVLFVNLALDLALDPQTDHIGITLAGGGCRVSLGGCEDLVEGSDALSGEFLFLFDVVLKIARQ